MPHKSIDPLIVGITLAQSIQSLASRNIDSLDIAVVSVCRFLSGTAINVTPDSAVLEGTVRTLSVKAQETILAQSTAPVRMAILFTTLRQT